MPHCNKGEKPQLSSTGRPRAWSAGAHMNTPARSWLTHSWAPGASRNQGTGRDTPMSQSPFIPWHPWPCSHWGLVCNAAGLDSCSLVSYSRAQGTALTKCFSSQWQDEWKALCPSHQSRKWLQKPANTGKFIILQLRGTEPEDLVTVKNMQPMHTHKSQASKHTKTKLKAKPKQNYPIILCSSTLPSKSAKLLSFRMPHSCFQNSNALSILIPTEASSKCKSFSAQKRATHSVCLCISLKRRWTKGQKGLNYSQCCHTSQGGGQSRMLVLNPSWRAARGQLHPTIHTAANSAASFPSFCSHLTPLMFSAQLQFSFMGKLQCWETTDLSSIPM